MHQFESDLSKARWFKSTHSSASRDCVEVAFLSSSFVGVRDSKYPDDPALVFSGGVWDAFITAVADGAFRQS